MRKSPVFYLCPGGGPLRVSMSQCFHGWSCRPFLLLLMCMILQKSQPCPGHTGLSRNPPAPGRGDISFPKESCDCCCCQRIANSPARTASQPQLLLAYYQLEESEKIPLYCYNTVSKQENQQQMPTAAKYGTAILREKERGKNLLLNGKREEFPMKHFNLLHCFPLPSIVFAI